MDWLVQSAVALLRSRGELFVYLTAAVALAGMFLFPEGIRRRLRTALVLAVVFAVFHRVLTPAAAASGAADDVRALTTGIGALAITRVGFVLGVDVAWERLGKRPMNALVRDLLQLGAYLTVVLIVLRMVNVKASGLLATGTVLGAIIGLSLQETLGHLAAGLAIQIERPIRVGDWVQLDKIDLVGRVTATNWRAVTVEADDRGVLVVPNGVFARTPVVNHSRLGLPNRRSLYLVFPFDVTPARVQEAIMAACRGCPHVLEDPAPTVFPWRATERGLEYWVRFFIPEFAVRDRAQAELVARIYYELRRRKVAFAVPAMHQYLHERDEEARSRDAEEARQDRRHAIDRVDFLAPLSDFAKDALAGRAHRKVFYRGEVIIRAGDRGTSFCVVRRGEVVVRVGDKDIQRLGAGDFFGELALLTGGARVADVVAESECEVLEINEEMFREVLQKEPEVAHTISHIVARRRAELEAAIEAGGGPKSKTDPTGLADEILKGIRRVFGLS